MDEALQYLVYGVTLPEVEEIGRSPDTKRSLGGDPAGNAGSELR